MIDLRSEVVFFVINILSFWELLGTAAQWVRRLYIFKNLNHSSLQYI